MKYYLSKLKTLIFIQLIFTTIYSITVALIPLLNQYLFDHVLEEGWPLVFNLLGLFLLLITVNSISQYISRIYEWKVSKKFFIEIKQDLFEHIVSIKNSEFQKQKPSEYLSVFNNNVEAIDEDYISPIIDTIKSIINILIFSSAMVFFLDWRIALTLFITSVLTAMIPRLFKKQLSVKRKKQLLALQTYFGKVVDLLSGKNRINSITFSAFIKVHRDTLMDSENKRYTFGQYNTFANMLNALGMFFIQIVTFGLVGYLLVKQEITIGTGIATFGYVSSFLTPIQNILDCTNLIHSTRDTIKQTNSYLVNELIDKNKTYVSPIKIDSLTVQSISFKCDQFKLLPVNYTFVKGKKYAIIGHSGSGKSTFLRIIDGTLDSGNGKVLVNGQVADKGLLNHIIFSISQYEHLFQADFINNITVFKSHQDGEPLIEELLEKLNTETRTKIMSYVNVDQLSGGEKQILGLLRMLAANSQVIMMDESFSNIDRKNSLLIHDYLVSLKDRIIIEVTHNISEDNLKNYDHILSFNEGKLEIIK